MDICSGCRKPLSPENLVLLSGECGDIGGLEKYCSACVESGEHLLKVDALDALDHQIWLCAKCLFFNKTEYDQAMQLDYGECRRRDPDGEDRWPQVWSNDWCGESKPNKEVLAKMRPADLYAPIESTCGDDCGCDKDKPGTEAVGEDHELTAPAKPVG